MDPVVEQLEAYNDRDLDRFVSCYSDDVIIEDGESSVLMAGHESMREMYGTLFDISPELHCRLLNRIRVGDYVIDEEEITGINLEGHPDQAHAVVVFRIVDDKIAHVRLLM